MYASLTTSISPIAAFAALFSILSIISTIFEHISARLLLSAETVLVIQMHVHSEEIAHMQLKNFKKIENHRMRVVNELSKVIDIDRRLIELLLPIQTRAGVDLKFYIRSDKSKDTRLLNTIHTEIQSGFLANVCVV